MRELVCNGQLGARAAVKQFIVITSNSESILQQQFGKIPRNDCCYSIYVDISTIVWFSISRLLYITSLMKMKLVCKISRHGQNGSSFVPKKILTWVPREAKGGLKADKRQQPYNHFIHTVCCYFLFLSARVLFSLPGYARNHFSRPTLWG